jgi:hypothetical protein
MHQTQREKRKKKELTQIYRLQCDMITQKLEISHRKELI